MSDSRTVSRIVVIVAVVIGSLSMVGLIVMLAVNAFVLDKYNAYGEVPIPGKTVVYLPAGEVAVNLHTQVIGSPRWRRIAVASAEHDDHPACRSARTRRGREPRRNHDHQR